VCLFVCDVQADMLYRAQGARSGGTTHVFQVARDADTEWNFANTYLMKSADLDEYLRVFCVDKDTPFSDALDKGSQAYDAALLNSSEMTLYSLVQKDALNALFSHVYSSVYDDSGMFIDGAEVASYMFQIAVWEIIHETTGTYAVDDGSFKIQSAKTLGTSGWSYDLDYYNAGVELANSWFSAIAGAITWDSIGYLESTDYDLTVYVAEGGTSVSQTFISISGPGSSNVTPEPSTLLILGLSLAGLGFVRRKKLGRK
jgi:hypothetical protein